MFPAQFGGPPVVSCWVINRPRLFGGSAAEEEERPAQLILWWVVLIPVWVFQAGLFFVLGVLGLFGNRVQGRQGSDSVGPSSAAFPFRIAFGALALRGAGARPRRFTRVLRLGPFPALRAAFGAGRADGLNRQSANQCPVFPQDRHFGLSEPSDALPGLSPFRDVSAVLAPRNPMSIGSSFWAASAKLTRSK